MWVRLADVGDNAVTPCWSGGSPWLGVELAALRAASRHQGTFGWQQCQRSLLCFCASPVCLICPSSSSFSPTPAESFPPFSLCAHGLLLSVNPSEPWGNGHRGTAGEMGTHVNFPHRSKVLKTDRGERWNRDGRKLQCSCGPSRDACLPFTSSSLDSLSSKASKATLLELTMAEMRTCVALAAHVQERPAWHGLTSAAAL